MSSAEYYKEPVTWFLQQMLRKLGLPINVGKEHWEGKSNSYLLALLRREYFELDEAIKAGDKEEIIKECADIANFAMMIADNQRDE